MNAQKAVREAVFICEGYAANVYFWIVLLYTFAMNRYETKARLVFHFAREESEALAHVVLDPEHLLLGLLRTDSTAARLLLNAGVTLNGARSVTRELMMQGAEANRKSKTEIGFRTRRVMERAGREAERLGSKSINTEHILLAILSEDDGAVKRVLQRLTPSPDSLRPRVLEVLALDESTATVPQTDEKAGKRRPNRPFETVYRLLFGRARKPKTAGNAKPN